MFLKTIKAALFVAVLIFLFFSAWFSYEFYLTSQSLPEKIFFDVEKGKGTKSISQDLKEKGIIKKKWPFLLGYKFFFSSQSLKAGEYIFHGSVSPKSVLNTLIEGKVYLHPLTVPEGLTRKEMAQHLQSLDIVKGTDFLEASSLTKNISSLDKDALDLEGYLFPETYHFPKGTSAKKIVSAMTSQFKEIFNAKWQKKARELGMETREVVIFASLIEKETSLPEEKNLVSAVFHNRLNRGMKLDCDPTIIYALKQEGRFKGRLRTKDLKLVSPYNTYLYPGLPPGPICNPGRESLEAVLFPAEEIEFFYFVSKNNGSHHFSRTFREHQRAVQKYQRR